MVFMPDMEMVKESIYDSCPYERVVFKYTAFEQMIDQNIHNLWLETQRVIKERFK